MPFLSYPKSKSGLTLIGVVVAQALMAIVILALMSFGKILNKQRVQSTSSFQTSSLRNSLYGLITHPGAWGQTIRASQNSRASGPALDCLLNQTPCTISGADLGAGGTAINRFPVNVVTNAAADIFYDATNPSAGFTLSGVPCTGFVAPPAAGSDTCPLRFNLTWSARCRGTCRNPQVEVQGQAIYNPAGARQIAFNSDNYSFVAFVGGGSGSWVRSYLSGAISIPGGPPTTSNLVRFANIEQDALGEYDTGAGVFTPRSSGIFQISVSMALQPPAPPGSWSAYEHCKIWIRKNGIEVSQASKVVSAVPNACEPSLSTTLQLAAGDQIAIYAYHTHTAQAVQLVAFQPYTNLSIVQIR